MSNIAIKGLVHSPYSLDERSHISIITSRLNLFRAFNKMYTQYRLLSTMYIKPIAAPYIPTCYIALAVDIEATPTYNFIKFAIVITHGEVRNLLFFLLRCLFENAESVYPGQLSLGFPLGAFTLTGGGSLLFDILIL